jgi:ferrous iron transport protein A
MVKFLKNNLDICGNRCRKRRKRGCAPCSLCDIRPGDRARIKCIRSKGGMRHRLFALGLMPDVQVDVVKRAPLGDPIELRLQDGSLTLSKSEAAEIEVEPV